MKKGMILTLGLVAVLAAGYMVMGEIHHGFVMGYIPKPGS